MDNIKLSAPWILYVDAVNALFGRDDNIDITFDENTLILNLNVRDDKSKAEAIASILPSEKTFGGVVLKINVQYDSRKDKVALFEAAFKDNPAFKEVITLQMEGMTNPINYFVFNKEVVQYWTDNLGDPFGLRSTLYQDIAEEVFDNHEGILFCTNSVEEDNKCEYCKG